MKAFLAIVLSISLKSVWSFPFTLDQINPDGALSAGFNKPKEVAAYKIRGQKPCDQPVRYRIALADSQEELSYFTYIPVERSTDCARACLNNPRCKTAMYTPVVVSSSVGECALAETILPCSGELPDEREPTERVLILCVTCGETPAKEVVNVPMRRIEPSQPVQQTVPEPTTQKQTEPATMQQCTPITREQADRPTCSRKINYRVVQHEATQEPKLYFYKSVVSHADCAKLCYEDPKCKAARFTPFVQWGLNAECGLSEADIPCVGEEVKGSITSNVYLVEMTCPAL